jgi:XrtJ-associated TM-motif-TM protein
MKKFGYILMGLALLATAGSLPLFAQGGCVDSPENPTVVFGVIAGAAVIGLGPLRSRIASWRRPKSK